ncbi:alpha-ketoglutarate-dependent dioxygenase alkB homolog 6-like isoform X2 [Apostichopus japonicus]
MATQDQIARDDLLTSEVLKEDISAFKVHQAPDTVYYIPDFITANEEKHLLHQVYAAPKPKWTQLSHRRLQNWGGLPHPKGMIVEKLPGWLDVYAKKIAKYGLFEEHVPNHVLVNEYKPGQGIMPHEDGPLFYPVVTTINLGSHSVLQFSHHSVKQQMVDDGSKDFSLLLQPRSLLMLKNVVYTDYLHGIAELSKDTLGDDIVNLDATGQALGDCLLRETRVSLTIRYVPKTLKVKLMLGKR